MHIIYQNIQLYGHDFIKSGEISIVLKKFDYIDISYKKDLIKQYHYISQDRYLDRKQVWHDSDK